MPKTGRWKWEWGEASKGFAVSLLEAGKTLTPKAAALMADACSEFLANTDWDWPRGQRYNALHESVRNVRGSRAYASGYRGGDADHPWYTGNLHDSIATGVISGTRILHTRYMQPGATEYQTYKGQIVDGYAEAENSIRRAAHTFSRAGVSNTLRAVLTVGVPYAYEVNHSDKHYDFIGVLQQDFQDDIMRAVEDLSRFSIRTK